MRWEVNSGSPIKPGIETCHMFCLIAITTQNRKQHMHTQDQHIQPRHIPQNTWGQHTSIYKRAEQQQKLTRTHSLTLTHRGRRAMTRAATSTFLSARSVTQLVQEKWESRLSLTYYKAMAVQHRMFSLGKMIARYKGPKIQLKKAYRTE